MCIVLERVWLWTFSSGWWSTCLNGPIKPWNSLTDSYEQVRASNSTAGKGAVAALLALCLQTALWHHPEEEIFLMKYKINPSNGQNTSLVVAKVWKYVSLDILMYKNVRNLCDLRIHYSVIRYIIIFTLKQTNDQPPFPRSSWCGCTTTIPLPHLF